MTMLLTGSCGCWCMSAAALDWGAWGAPPFGAMMGIPASSKLVEGAVIGLRLAAPVAPLAAS